MPLVSRAIRPERRAALRRRLAFVSLAPGGDRPLLDLSTIHFARWSIVTQLPHPDGSGRPRRLSWAYLLFAAAYDGGEREYLDAFTDTLPQRIQKVFGGCVGFQARVEEAPGADGPRFPAWAFRRFVECNLLPQLAFAAADPSATVEAIRQAIAIERVDRRSTGLRGEALGRAQVRVEGLALGRRPAGRACATRCSHRWRAAPAAAPGSSRRPWRSRSRRGGSRRPPHGSRRRSARSRTPTSRASTGSRARCRTTSASCTRTGSRWTTFSSRPTTTANPPPTRRPSARRRAMPPTRSSAPAPPTPARPTPAASARGWTAIACARTTP